MVSIPRTPSSRWRRKSTSRVPYEEARGIPPRGTLTSPKSLTRCSGATTTTMSVPCECARFPIRPRRTDSPGVAAFPPRRVECSRRAKLIRDRPARAPLTRPLTPSPKRSPLHDAAEVGDVELIVKLLSKESNDGDFNPVRLAPPSLPIPRSSSRRPSV